jgi:hypothetical protein
MQEIVGPEVICHLKAFFQRSDSQQLKILLSLLSSTAGPQFTNKFSEQKTSHMTNGFSDYEHASWQQQQAESISMGVSCWLTLAQFTSLLDFGLRTLRFMNGLQERIKFMNRDPTL